MQTTKLLSKVSKKILEADFRSLPNRKIEFQEKKDFKMTKGTTFNANFWSGCDWNPGVHDNQTHIFVVVSHYATGFLLLFKL